MEATLSSPLGRTTLQSEILTLGRMPDNRIVLNDPLISSHHAEIRPTEQGYSVVDLGSTNGTFVNEMRLEHNIPRRLVTGDHLRLGSTVFTYEVAGAAPIEPTVAAVPGQDYSPGAAPTVMAAPPAYTNYPPVGQQDYMQAAPTAYQAPPPPYQPYQAAPSPYEVASPYAPIAAPVQKKPNRRLIIGGIIGVVLILIIVGAISATRSTAEKTLTTFCNDLKTNNSHDAYQQLSSRAQRQQTEAAFTASMQSLMTQLGGLKDCTVSNVSDNGNQGAGVMTWIANLASAPPIIIDSILVNENGTWKIDSLKARQ